MSTKVINFTKIRIPMLILSFAVIVGGIIGTNVNSGYNLGIDFLSGINLRVQIADEAFSVSYSGEDRTVFNIQNSELSITTYRNGGLDKVVNSFPLSDYTTVGDLMTAVSALENIEVTAKKGASAPASSLAGLNYPVDLSAEGTSVNTVNDKQSGYIDIASVRDTLSVVGSPQIQVVGNPADQEFIIRLQDPEGDRNFSEKANKLIKDALGKKFGSGNIIIKQSDYVGPRFSQSIGYQSVTLTCFALALILVYIWLRFKLSYAVAAISALVHDVLVMIGIIGTFQIEVNTATIAALLTIIGYSLNDTIVIFDRIRENVDLLREKDFIRIVNISISQSLSRTLITSLTTMLAVIAIFVFGTGVIRVFALNLMIGVIVGTYSSIFIASPILLAWISFTKNRRIEKAEKKYIEKKGKEEEPANQEISAEAPVSSETESGEAASEAVKKGTVSRKQRKRKTKK